MARRASTDKPRFLTRCGSAAACALVWVVPFATAAAAGQASGPSVRVRLGADQAWSDEVAVAGGSTASRIPATCGNPDIGANDERDVFGASAYLGWAFDNFAPGEVGGYGNLKDTGGIQNRYIFGVNFEYRLIGSADDDRQLWVFGETLHGVRSADVDCKAENKPPVCGTYPDLRGAPEAALFILERASRL